MANKIWGFWNIHIFLYPKHHCNMSEIRICKHLPNTMTMRTIAIAAVIMAGMPCGMKAQSLEESESNNYSHYINIDPWVSEFFTVDGVLFSGNGLEWSWLVKFPNGDEREEYAIPEGVSRICNGAFTGCKNLKRLVIPSSVRYIGERAFEGSSIERFEVRSSEYGNGVKAPIGPPSTKSLHNVQGQSIATPLPHEVYVEDGVKKMAR